MKKFYKKHKKRLFYIELKDFEDAVIYASAIHSNVDAVITRNTKDFKVKEIPIYEPQEFLQILKILK
ncbi:hypothetical protein [Persephonella sp.]|uniref:hypothetical protein n=1 Tax=Persephonella sp. TaxID=2060922 RepID=UPI00261FAC75|nr:hypothetical protein [Persephonella sp.]